MKCDYVLAAMDSCFVLVGPHELFFCIFLARVHFDGAMKEHETEAHNGQDRSKRPVPTLARVEILVSTGCRAQVPEP